jgi:hypothetical protein
MQSNALVRSQDIPVMHSFLFQALNTVCTSLKMAVTVDTLSRKPVVQGPECYVVLDVVLVYER